VSKISYNNDAPSMDVYIYAGLNIASVTSTRGRLDARRSELMCLRLDVSAM
jgi:hypothetical protein